MKIFKRILLVKKIDDIKLKININIKLLYFIIIICLIQNDKLIYVIISFKLAVFNKILTIS